MLRLVLRAVRRQISTKIRFFKSNETDIVSSRQQMLQQVTKKLNIDIYPSIIEKDEPTKAKRLTNADKMQLGLYIPQSQFNHRLSRHVEKQYLPHITKQLYIQQKENLESYFRILQNNFFLENKRITLDKYVNLIYKDIYSRYLVSKGVGVEWNGFFADKGVMNEYNVGQYDAEEKMFENFSVLLDFIQNQSKSIKRKRTIGMYSHKEQKFIHTDRVEIEKVKKLGYYIKAQFTEFGQFGEQFRMLQQKNGKAYLMVFVQQLEKLINPNAICAIQEDKYIVLKKFINENELEIEYLMVALDCYKQHQKYFKDRDYQKHSTFDGKYLVGMKVMDLPVIPEISEYQRPPNCYIVNSNYHIGDFERVNASDIPHLQHFISEQGQLIIDGQQSQIMVNDLKLTKQLQELLIKRGINFMDVYDPFDDQVYYDSQTKNILRFRTGFSYYVDVEGNGGSIFQCLKRQNSIISESKITLPTLNLGKKPRERRRFRKERKQVIEQITEHYSLEQALVEINSISLSSLSQSVYSILFFMKNGRALAYEEVLTEQEMEKMVKNQLSEQTMVRIQNEGIQVEKVFANESLIQALLYLKNVKNSKEILNIIIEPQSETQVLVPYTLHLNYIINKQKKKRRGTSQTKMNINMIKLHPTFEQKTRSLDVKALIEGVVKSNGRQQYGLGFEALRLWVAKNDHLMGDRVITQTDINMQLQHGTHIRRVYWDLLSLMPQKINQNIEPKLYINTFMLDSIDCYITHMQECYKTMNIHKAYELTNDFFFNIVNQIFVKAVRKRIIAYPNHQENQQHFVVIRRILQLLAVISPLFPFSAYHVSKIKMLKWPEIRNLRFYETLLTHNQMIKTRVNIMNKLQLNDLRHAYLYVQTLKEPFSQRDLELFFDVDKVTMKRPDEDSRKCSVNLPKMCVFTEDSKAVFYVSEDYCVRCDSKSQQTQHLCSTCVDYLQQQIGQPFKYFPTRSEEKPSPKLDNL